MSYSKIAISWSIWSGLVVVSGVAALSLQYSRTEYLVPPSVDDVGRLQVILQLVLFAVSFVGSVILFRLKEKGVWFFRATLFGILAWYFAFEVFVPFFGKDTESFWVPRIIGGLLIIVAPCIYMIWSLQKEQTEALPR